MQVMHQIRNNWTEEINSVVKKRREKKIETKFEVSDLLRAKIMFDSVDHLRKSIEGVDQFCYENKFEVIEVANRLKKVQTQDVVFKIKIK